MRRRRSNGTAVQKCVANTVPNAALKLPEICRAGRSTILRYTAVVPEVVLMNVSRVTNQAGVLACAESLQRAPSPILFPENVPGAAKHNTENDGMLSNKQKSFRTDLSPDDVKLVNELGRLTPDQLADYIKNVQNSAYNLGLEEARQFSRGKMLQIFNR
ncbi:hypothetical protein GCK32_000484 [Trichostrongylus colubriformis]|uniref:Uncharacterized protein n=1 Tax=Trichostrongylus colubriformis TaxID=6319 RepID=A0AAN8FCS3_TRICO